MPRLKISDCTLRDGSHAIAHQLSEEQIRAYASIIDEAGLSYVEVGHGNGLGASSFQVGQSLLSDDTMLRTAKECLKKTKLSVHVMPGCATVDKDIKPALAHGVDVFRIASHCTEADITQTHIEFLSKRNIDVFGVLMMSHMIDKEGLLDSCKKMESYGAQGIILMDSAGAYVPQEVFQRISFLKESVDIELGFHAHNNLGLAMSNTIAALEAGATILDGTARGFGAGAGNCQLEVLVPVLGKLGYETGINLYKVLDAAEIAEEKLIKELPFSKTMSIVTGLSGLFSGFAKPIKRLAALYGVDPKEVVFELGKRKIIAGQEDMILEVINNLLSNDAAQKFS